MNLIKRYSNRKLYSVTQSRYVSLADVLALHHKCDVLIVDNKTKADITKWVLSSAKASAARKETIDTPAAADLEPRVPLIAPGIFGELIASIVANAARDVRQAKGEF